MTRTLRHAEPLGCLIDGQWRALDLGAPRVAPSDTGHIITHAIDGSSHVEACVRSARTSARAWSRVDLDQRVALLETFATVLDERVEEHALWITTEIGKPLREALAEARALGRKVRLSLRIAEQECVRHSTADASGYWRLRPLGVIAVLGPFNFPMHLSNGHIAPALVAGNAVILKPSEHAPSSAERYVDAWLEACERAGADSARGALSLLPGGGEAGARLAAHEGVDGVGFTGSWEVGVAIRQANVRQTHKLLALEMGGKNATLVRADADLERAAEEIVNSALWSCGQRCTATSRVLVHASVADALTERVCARVAAQGPGDPLEETTVYGPLATEAARDRFAGLLDERAGLTLLAHGPPRDDLRPGWWVRPRVFRVDDRDAARERVETEVFGPELLFEQVRDDEELVARAEATPWGLAASVFTADGAAFERVSSELSAGVLNWNRGTIGASSELPFGGSGRSGNHRPVGSWAIWNCARPVSTLEG